MENGEHVVLVLRSLPRSRYKSPAISRLRMALKTLLRCFGFRCEFIGPGHMRDAVVVRYFGEDDTDGNGTGSSHYAA